MSMPYLGDPSLVWTADQLVAALGPMPLSRIVFDPPPGTATVEDALQLNERHDSLCELIDGTLVRKAMGAYESFLAVELIALLSTFVRENKLGIVLAPDGMLRLQPDQVRLPDVSFLSNLRLKSSGFPQAAVLRAAPDLAVEIISPGNTREEMDRKLRDYFTAGTRLVWYVYPETKNVHVFTAVDNQTVLGEQDQLTGGEVLPGLVIDLAKYFETPEIPQ
ncbi:MAG: Uma2 family endonuclease [Pirellulales bacterium]|nr:Uma2 family endonuclease [Pirellulales bacterium]